MRRSLSLAMVVVVALLGSPLASLAVPQVSPTAWAASPDDEIVLLDSSGRIRVVDPHVAANTLPVSWQSPDTGWEQIVLQDVNGDGDKEIVAMKPGQIRVFDPVAPNGSTPAGAQIFPPTGQQWLKLTGGDTNKDGRDEIIATSSGTTPVAEKLFVYRGNPTGTSFTAAFTDEYGAGLKQVTTGDVNGDGYSDILWIRDSSNLLHIKSGKDWSKLHEATYVWYWSMVGTVNVATAYPGDEIYLVRNVLGLNNHWVERFTGVGLPLTAITGTVYFPVFTDMGAGDFNGDGDEEIVLVRDPVDPRASVIVLNPAGSFMRVMELTIGRQWRQVAAGDLDGDSKAEFVVLSDNEYRIYTQPDVSDAYDATAGAFSTTALAVGNLDGTGIPSNPILDVSPASLTFNVGSSGVAPSQSVSVSNVGPGGSIPWSASVVSGGGWLQVTPASGTTPAGLSVSVNAAGLTSGTYNGTIRVTAPGAEGSPKDVSVTLTVTSATLSINPLSLVFSAQLGGSNPAPQSVTVTNVGGGPPLAWTANKASGGAWLSTNPASGSTPASFNVNVDIAGLSEGTYDGSIQITAPGASNNPQTVLVRLTVTAPTMIVSPKQLLFTFGLGAGDISVRSVSITQEGGGNAISWVAGAIPSGNWTALSAKLSSGNAALSYGDSGLTLVTAGGVESVDTVDWLAHIPESGRTPTIMQVQVDPSGLSAGQYRATIVVDGGPTTGNRLEAVDVTLIIYGVEGRRYIPVLLN